MKAWRIDESDESHAVIVFHNHGLAARRLGADELGIDFEYAECERIQKYDQYSELGYVPIEVLVKDGWWFECWHCYKQISEDMEHFEKVVFVRNGVYCSPKCRQDRKDHIAKINSDAEEFYISLVNAWCKWDIEKFEGGWPLLNPTARITFQGAKYGGSVTVRGHKKSEFQLHVASGDLKKYEEWHKNHSSI